MLHHAKVGIAVTLLAAVAAFSRLRAQDAAPPAPAPGRQVAASFAATSEGKDASIGYLIYLPQDYSPRQDTKWPILLFLHGIGERGNQVEKVKTHGPPKLIDQGQHFPFVVVSPQCPDEQRWNADVLAKLVDQLLHDYRIDPDRVYVTGLSMGGFGTWELCSRYPDKFAAAVPICGGGDPATVSAMKQIPTWVFHGDADTAVPIMKSREMVEALEAAGGNVRFTVYKDVGHDSWTRTYQMDELYEWLLTQKREHQ